MVRVDLALICPSFVGSARDASDFAEEFGTYTDRYVAQYPSNWIDLWHSRLKYLPPVERLAASKRRAEMQRALVRLSSRSNGYDPAKSWAENATEVAAMRAVPHVVGDYEHPEPFRNWPAEIDSIRQRRPRPWTVGSTSDDYRRLAEHLLRVAPEAFVIDPYFDPLSDAGRAITATFIGLLKDSCCFELHFIIARERSGRTFTVEPGKMFERELQQAFAPELQHGRTLVIHIVDDKDRRCRPFRLHDRYFLTRYGARFISSGFVLDVSRDGAFENKVRNIPREEIADLFVRYVDGVESQRAQRSIAKFRVCGER